ncbi:hypothetical protein NMG60_11006596 [Bertholletia excelsa]
MVWGRSCCREVLLFTVMVAVESCLVGANTLFKAAKSHGLSNYVFMVYSSLASTVFILPMAILSYRRSVLPPFKVSFLYRMGLLALIEFFAMMLRLKGVEYASPTLASALSNLIPAFTFILAVIFRMEKVSLTSRSSQAKVMGTLVSISGALVVVLYAGPALIRPSSPSDPLDHVLMSQPSDSNHWVLGGLLLAVNWFLVSVWLIIQTSIVKEYPAEFVLVFFFNLLFSVISTPVCFIVEPALNKWKLGADMSLLAILFGGLAGHCLGAAVHTWGLHLKGPVYVASFRPLSIAIAAFMGVICLGDTLYLGCVVGAITISMGFYAVIWGKAKEAKVEEYSEFCTLESPSPENVPLLK